MTRSASPAPIAPIHRLRIFPDPATLPLPVYRDFVEMLFGMRFPILGLGTVFVAICLLVGRQMQSDALIALAIAGAVTTLARLWTIRAYHRGRPARFDELRVWERRYAIGNLASAAMLALLNVIAIAAHNPLNHMVAVSLVFGFGAGIVSRTSVRPGVCVAALLTATVPTVIALTLHAARPHDIPLHSEMFLTEAFIVAAITGLSLQTVAHLYRSAVEHHTARYDMAKLARTDALTGLSNRLLLRELFQDRAATALRARSLVALHYLDLDGFKAINDHHGHPAGDALLEQVARRIIRDISKPYKVEGQSMEISVSVGIATAPKLGVELERLLACADAALYRAKKGGKARALFCLEADVLDAELAA